MILIGPITPDHNSLDDLFISHRVFLFPIGLWDVTT